MTLTVASEVDSVYSSQSHSQPAAASECSRLRYVRYISHPVAHNKGMAADELVEEMSNRMQVSTDSS
jgi:hypothetical protein